MPLRLRYSHPGWCTVFSCLGRTRCLAQLTGHLTYFNLQVLPCSKRYCHDWTTCPFSHPGEKARRRDPRTQPHTGIACPDRKKVCADHCFKFLPWFHLQYAQGLFLAYRKALVFVVTTVPMLTMFLSTGSTPQGKCNRMCSILGGDPHTFFVWFERSLYGLYNNT